MADRRLLELCGHIIFSFTRSVSDLYNPAEPEFFSESLGYNPLQSTGLEWYCQPVEELIYQEYSDTQTARVEYPTYGSVGSRLVNASSTDDPDEEDLEPEIKQGKAMAWKRLRPSILRTVCNSLYIGALMSLLTASFVGAIYMVVSFLSYKITNNCEFLKRQSIPIKIQWIRTISDMASCSAIHAWYFVNTFVLFRSFQLKGVKRVLLVVSCVCYSLDSGYRLTLQALGKSYSKMTLLQKLPLITLCLVSIVVQATVLAKHFYKRPKRKRVILLLQLTIPYLFSGIMANVTVYFIYPAYNHTDEEGKLLIAVFAPLIGVLLKSTYRICAQRLWNITDPGTSFVLLAPLYSGAAVMFRILQEGLGELESIAVLGIIHGAVEVFERSTMVLSDHIYNQIYERRSAPWGHFRTPRRERLTADIAIMSMVFESSAIVSVNGFLYLYKLIYVPNTSLSELLQPFAISTAVPLVIEWFFTSLSLAIETRYQNMPVMAVWRRRWKRHVLVAIINAVPFAVWGTSNLLIIVQGRFSQLPNRPCKMPFT